MSIETAAIERALVTVDTVSALSGIPDADAIEVAHVRGWEVVVKKGEFAPGDSVLYFEIDSALPLDDERFEFLALRSEKVIDVNGVPTRVHVLKTARLRGVYSQGLVLAAADFPEVDAETGSDVTHLLGITKFEVPIPEGQYVGPFPDFVRKTGAERVQNITASVWAQIQADVAVWVPVEKIDGVSVTVWRDEDGEFHLASRRWELARNDDSPYWGAVIASGVFDHMAPGDWLQGEVAGYGLPSNRLGLPDARLFVFSYGRGTDNAPSLGFDHWPAAVTSLAAPRYDLTLPATIAETVAQADGIKSLITPKSHAEGIVWTRNDGGRVLGLDDRHVLKAISQKYLLKSKD